MAKQLKHSTVDQKVPGSIGKVFSLPFLPFRDYSLWLKEPGGKLKTLNARIKFWSLLEM